MQLQRFGQPIPNIEALDKLSANKSAAEMGERMQAMAAEWEEELQARDIELKAASKAQMEAMEENTRMLKALQELLQKKMQLESALDSSTQAIITGFTVAQQKEPHRWNLLSAFYQNITKHDSKQTIFKLSVEGKFWNNRIISWHRHQRTNRFPSFM